MQQYIIKRLLLMIPTLFGVAIFIFVLMRVLPGDIVLLRMTSEGGSVTEEVIAIERARLGLDQPMWQQFTTWMGGILLRGDFGVSMWTGRPISYEISTRFQLSLQVALMATFVSILISIPLGVLSAFHQDTWIDYAIRVFSIAGLAIPSFWLGILIILFLLIYFQWVPPMIYTPIWEDPVANIQQLIWPAVAVGYRYSAVSTRMARSACLEVLREDYMRTARSKGLRGRVALMRHCLPNALLPVITVIGLEFAFLFGGLIVTEQVFNLNGLGRLFVQSISQRDYTMTQSLVLLIAAAFIIVNFIVDILYARLDPRIRYQ
ncbi:MAG: ABC transporter permease [Chloroflexota bacterium]